MGAKMECEVCGREVDDGTLSCPCCGAPAPARAKSGSPAPWDFSRRYGERKKLIGAKAMIAKIGACALVGPALAILLVFGLSRYYEGIGEDAKWTVCQSNQRLVDEAIKYFSLNSGRYPASLEELYTPGSGNLRSIPTCPSGEKAYVWVEGKDGGPPCIRCPNRTGHAVKR